MITQLTKEQQARLPELAAKWARIGLCTDPADRKRAEIGVHEAYKAAGLASPKYIVWCGSPLSQGLTQALVRFFAPWTDVGTSVKKIVGNKVSERVWDRVEDSSWDFVWNTVSESIKESIKEGIKESVWESVWESVKKSVKTKVSESVWESLKESVWESVKESCYGQDDASWFEFCDYFRLACPFSSETQQLRGLLEIAESAGWWLPYRNICWISERHNVIHLNERKRLHKDGSFALQYPDGWGVYALNGVRVEPWMAETPVERLEPQKVLAVTNVEQRRELIRKVGVEQLLALLPHKLLNKVGDYELISIELSPGLRDARYLKMLNPSIGVWHIEGVHPSCKTVQEANNWRAGDIAKEWDPSMLT